ncbi:MAG: hypothetical protein RJA22_1879 [Verrucomicrobiota bacterium]|jgi:hypothetical protein
MKAALVSLCLLGFLGESSTRAADVALFSLIKSQTYQQTSAGAPVALASNAFAFNAVVLASSNNVVTNATVDPSNSTPLRQLAATDPSQVLWRFEERFNTQAALDSVYPNGNIFLPVNYAMAMATVNDGPRSVNLSFSTAALLGYPPTPTVSNATWTAAQGIDTAADFTLRWTASGGAADLVQVFISDASSNVVYASPTPPGAGSLTGASNHIVIPAYTLPAASPLSGRLGFIRPGLPETNAYAGAIGVAALAKETDFPLLTRAAPVPPRLEVLNLAPPPFRLRFTGETNRLYQIQASTDLRTWGTIFTTNSPTGTGTFTDTASSLVEERYYRIRVGP